MTTSGSDPSADAVRRERGRPLKVFVTPIEREAIQAMAAGADLTVSSYLRAVGLNHRVHSNIDHEAVGQLLKLHADLGRLGGLLKLWLTERTGQGAKAYDVQKTLDEIRQTQRQMLIAISKVRRR